VTKHFQPLFRFLKKSSKRLHQRKYLKFFIVAGLAVVFLIGGAGVIAAVYFHQKPILASSYSYTLTLKSQDNITDQYTLRDTAEIEVRVVGQYTPTFFNKPPELSIKANLDDKTVLNSSFIPDSETTDIPVGTISLNPNEMGEEQHSLEVSLTSKDSGQTLDKKTITIMNDQTWPVLLKATSDKGRLTQYDVAQPATNSAIASSSAKTGLKLLSNTKGPFHLTLSFSELVQLGNGKKWDENLAGTNGSLVFTPPSSATVSATLTATSSQFTLPLSFQDQVGHELLSELQFVFDDQAPKLGELHNITLWEQTKDTFFFTFTSSEPLASGKATTNGVTKNATGGPKYYRVDGLPLNVGENMIKIVASDAAGNSTNAEIKATMNPGSPKTYSFDSFGSPKKLPENVRLCTDEDKKACGYENVSEMSCEEFKVVKDCLHNRCSRSGFSLGDCDG
jgi:hypothetical protein